MQKIWLKSCYVKIRQSVLAVVPQAQLKSSTMSSLRLNVGKHKFELIHFNVCVIKNLYFHQHLNWDAVFERRIKTPFIPRINNDMDVSNFSSEFTGMTPDYSPAAVPNNTEKVFRVGLPMLKEMSLF